MTKYSNLFNKAVETLLYLEGEGYDKFDVETRYGITLSTYTELGFEKNLQDITIDDAKEIYFRKYWIEPEICTLLPDELAFHVFIAGVNIGRRSAISLLQRILGIAEDGIIGDITYSVSKDVYNRNPLQLICDYIFSLDAYYRSIPAYRRYGRGWTKRMYVTLREGGKLS